MPWPVSWLTGLPYPPSRTREAPSGDVGTDTSPRSQWRGPLRTGTPEGPSPVFPSTTAGNTVGGGR
ncbi:hypothetical protein KPATCC21470_2214 [Kitasatospora purpeofusca]